MSSGNGVIKKTAVRKVHFFLKYPFFLKIAYRSARQAGEMDHPAFMAAMQAYEGHQPGDSEAGRVVGLMIHVATERTTEWFWKGAE